MNTADLCPRGQELKAEWKMWEQERKKWYHQPMSMSLRCMQAWQAYQEHVRECEVCDDG